MVELLRNKKLATIFQILVEIAVSQPTIQQKDIASRLELTPQAISEYIKQLIDDGLISSSGRSSYSISTKGVDWLLKELTELQDYSRMVEKVVDNIKVSAAIASSGLVKGQKVGLVMNEGLLYATKDSNASAYGVAMSAASTGDIVGISDIHGIISLDCGEVTILEVPDIRHGGSSQVDLERMKREVKGHNPVACCGIEALVHLNKIGLNPDYRYGVQEALIESAQSGLSPVVVCITGEVPLLVRNLQEAEVRYTLVDLRPARP